MTDGREANLQKTLNGCAALAFILVDLIYSRQIRSFFGRGNTPFIIESDSTLEPPLGKCLRLDESQIQEILQEQMRGYLDGKYTPFGELVIQRQLASPEAVLRALPDSMLRKATS